MSISDEIDESELEWSERLEWRNSGSEYRGSEDEPDAK